MFCPSQYKLKGCAKVTQGIVDDAALSHWATYSRKKESPLSFLLDDNVKPVFGRHEKFAFRHGWLKKGVDAAAEEPTIFSNDEALVRLGVGKNMVRSIRHWCQTVGLLEEIDVPGRAQGLGASQLADRLLAQGGWDPFIEEVATLWLLHWQLTTNQERSLVWNLAFSTFLEDEFTKKQLVNFLIRQFDKLDVRTTENMIRREVDCFLSTYVTSWTRSGALTEESLDCPLTELNLIRFLPEDGVYRFNIGPKPSLPAEVFGYGLISFLRSSAQTRRTVAVEECVYHAGSPGQAFKLDENSVMEYLEIIEERMEGRIRLQETAGLRQIYLHNPDFEELHEQATLLLDQYYA